MAASPQQHSGCTDPTTTFREIAVRCLYFGGLAFFVVVFWLGAISLVQIVGRIMQAGPP